VKRQPDLTFAVRGLPAPQGSKTAFVNPHTGRAGMKESSARVRPWRQDVVYAALEAIREHEASHGRWIALDGAVHLVVEFYMPRPQGHPKTRRTLPTSSPDLDKLLRSTGDALKTAGVWRDDSQVTDITIRERYAVTDTALGHPWELPTPGAVISVFAIDPAETWADMPLEQKVAAELPRMALPYEIGAHVADGPVEATKVFEVPAAATDSEAMATARKALTLVARHEKLLADGRSLAGSGALVIHGGSTRLASIPGAPLTKLQELVAEVAARGASAAVAVTLGGAPAVQRSDEVAMREQVEPSIGAVALDDLFD